MTKTSAAKNTSHSNRVRLFFGLTIGLGAGLLFWQELMLGRMMLPKFGGVPAVWLVSLAVFQTILLAGYALAHGVRHWSRSAILILLLVFAALAAAQQFFAPALVAPETVTPASVIVALCMLALFSLFLFSMISPLLQQLYARLPQPDAEDPYFLYSASNFGSFAGLLLFPLVLEPFGGLRLSLTIWLGVAVVFLACLAITLFMAGEEKKAKVKIHPPTAARKKWPVWFLYAFLPSALSFSATSHLINDIAPVPLLSMVPLGLYLLTFVLAFGKPAAWQNALLGAQSFLVAFYIFRLVVTGIHPSEFYDLLLVLAVFFTSALLCHRALAASRPPAGDLTFFYLIVALAGALGAIVNLTIIPFLLPLPLEFAGFLLVTLLFGWKQDWKNLSKPGWKTLRVLLAGACVACLLLLFIRKMDGHINSQIFPFVLLVTVGGLSIMPAWLSGYSLIVVIGMALTLPPTVSVQRDFYGVKRVVDRVLKDQNTYRTLYHGTTIHGMQQRTPKLTDDEFLYYSPGSGVWDVMHAMHAPHVAIVGLGTGALACMPDKAAKVRFFEIDPGIVDLAGRDFTFLKDCPPEDVVLGDARLTLQKDKGVYDLLVVDAFSSDAIPVHLLTQEAFAIYKARLKKDGVLLLHLSNRYLDLRPVAVGAARQLGWNVAGKHALGEAGSDRITGSEYMVLTPRADFVGQLQAHDKEWDKLEKLEPTAWTDDKLSIVPLIKFFRLDNYAQKN